MRDRARGLLLVAGKGGGIVCELHVYQNVFAKE